MSKNQFIYFLNAIHYMIWRGFLRFYYIIWKGILVIYLFILKCFMTEPSVEKYYNRFKDGVRHLDPYYNETKTRKYMIDADRWFMGICSSYFLGFMFIAVVISMRYPWSFVAYLSFGICIIAIILVWRFLDKAVLDNYLPYVKRFAKKDKEWHRKWKIITILFFVGVIPVLGLFYAIAMSLVDILLR